MHEEREQMPDPSACATVRRVGRIEPSPRAGMRVVLVNPYELGRQPFALAEPVAWLRREGFAVHCVDLSRQKLDLAAFAGARLVAIFLGMHTATRIAVELLPRLRAALP
ncbi:MAG TPA: hypothetical protein VIX81_09525, partial [Gammaproteobacteria bacterium]